MLIYSFFPYSYHCVDELESVLVDGLLLTCHVTSINKQITLMSDIISDGIRVPSDDA